MLRAFASYPVKTKVAWVLAIIAAIVYLSVEAQGKGDFHIYMSASADLFHDKDIYTTAYGDGFHYLYSLFFAILLYPLTFLPFYAVKLCWLLFNAFLLVQLFRLLFRFFPSENYTPLQKNILYAATLIFSARFMYENFHSGQITILILYSCVRGLYSIFCTPRWWLGCLWIAFGINIKLLPVVLIPYLLYRARFKEVALIGVIGMLFWLIPIAFIGMARNTFLLQQWWHMMNPTNELHVLDVSERSFHSLTTLLSTLFVANVPDIYALPLKRNIADVSLHTLSLIITGVRLALAALTLYFLRTGPFKPASSNRQLYLEWSYILAVVPLIFPHQQHYAFLFIVPAAIYITDYMIRQYTALSGFHKLFLWIGVVFIYLCCNLKLILGEYNPYYEHYKILTYGALWLLVVLVYVRRQETRDHTG